MIGVTVNTDGLQRDILRYLVGLDDVAHDALVEGGLAAIDSARETVAATTTRRTGSLEDDWHVGWLGKYERLVTNFSDHAGFIDQGTSPHRIEAVNARALAFQVSGQTIFRRFVNHPGTKARPFVALAQEAGQIAMRSSADSGLDRLARNF